MAQSKVSVSSGGGPGGALRKLAVYAVLLGIAGGLAWVIYSGYSATQGGPPEREELPAPVEVGAITRGPIVFSRTFSGTLEATAEFMVAPKISGRIKRLAVDLADPVKRGQLVAELDDQEYVQQVAQAEADLAVAQATLAEAKSTLDIAQRELDRVETLREQGIASESQYDTAKTQQLSGQARLEVARAQMHRAEASLESSRIRLAYTKVNAEWTSGSDERVVADRFVDEGDTVSANTAMLSIVELSPITASIFVTERDYGRIGAGQAAILTTDAFPGETFTGTVVRISPVFRQESRQARVELSVDNKDLRLKPGMFVRVTIELAREEEAIIVPVAALTVRAEKDGVFVVNEDGLTVSWRPVTPGLQDNDRIQVTGEGLEGRVVTLGQQLLDDGAAITIPERDGAGDGG